jgi:4'-phosphopantetheinyl transferase
MPRDAGSLSSIEVRAAASGAPEVFIGNVAAEVSISLSHRGGIAICVVAAPGIQLGCDLELIEPHSQVFVCDYFTAEEQAIVADCVQQNREALVSLMWSAKESALKAMKTGLREDTRSVSVYAPERFPGNGCWSPIALRTPAAGRLSGWWQRSESLLRTVVSSPAAQPPIQLV